MINRLVLRSLYPMAHHVIAASYGVADDLSTHYGVRRDRLSVVYNPVRRNEIRLRAEEPLPIDLPKPAWLAIGRLVPNKNFAMLIEAFAQAQVPGHLVILGEGPEHSNLTRLAALRQISDRVHLPGHVTNPYACLSHAYAYLSASNAEGFPNALVEALVLGCPVAVTDCNSGPAEILRGALAPKVGGMCEVENGILVPPGDAGAMAQAMRSLTVKTTHQRYAQAAERRADDFDLGQTINSYAAILDREVAGHSSSVDTS
jgi:N-acetylgalactosamine-N,N'-diacetylbacillosaminyl-diphospho-undecaprenol 4-alpha-N-acetylgalactosaminyltransferase